MAQAQVEKQIGKLLNSGNVDVKITPYSAMDLVAGKMRGFEIKGENISAEGFSVSSFEAKSMCDFIHLDYKKDPDQVPLAPLLLDFKATVSEKDLNNIVSSKEYQENLSQIKLKLNSSGA
ncbi:MAG: hypothetical protein MZU97_10920 [Bacillus subtilis]|nr:hypothetical protein [Bacillus subtilis]